MREFIPLLLLALVAGCGSGGLSNQQAQSMSEDPGATARVHAKTAATKAYPAANDSVVKSIPFPEGVTWMGDLVFARDGTFWVLAGHPGSIPWFLHIDARTGEVLDRIPNDIPTINLASELAFDGFSLWATSYGWENGRLQGLVYKLDPETGSVLFQFPCPATEKGFCEGLTWDGDSFWSSGSDKEGLVRFSPDGIVEETIPNLWNTADTKLDLAFDRITSRVITIKNGRPGYFDPQTRQEILGPSISRVFKGDWDGQLFWSANNLAKRIEGRDIGE